MLQNISGIFFDYFETIIDGSFAIKSVWSRIAHKYGVKISPKDPRIWEGMKNQIKAYEILREKYLKSNKEFRGLSVSDNYKINLHVIRAMGIEKEVPPDVIRDEFDFEFANGQNLNLHFGVKDTLVNLRKRNLKIGILSNGYKDQIKRNLERLGVLDYFEVFVCAGDHGYHKSEIEVYKFALRKMNAQNPETIVHVGDDPLTDVRMAQRVGMIPVLFTPYYIHKMDKVITIKQIPELLNYL